MPYRSITPLSPVDNLELVIVAEGSHAHAGLLTRVILRRIGRIEELSDGLQELARFDVQEHDRKFVLKRHQNLAQIGEASDVCAVRPGLERLRNRRANVKIAITLAGRVKTHLHHRLSKIVLRTERMHVVLYGGSQRVRIGARQLLFEVGSLQDGCRFLSGGRTRNMRSRSHHVGFEIRAVGRRHQSCSSGGGQQSFATE